MLLLARCLDWLCLAFASGVQDEMRLNDLIVGHTPQSTAVHEATARSLPHR
ncbi:hypothetical protein EBBID32_43530 [Sphingobium indicum BiD32]|uniref:Uncharacterized protein n=1 Tax=Sphingobium indicum BiD32 TaxID=1301087 RepID=N1MWN1_9SPHN|nr:hypothetical protein EBBID32_43530 [Sphingobium indicum BiD32]